MFNTLDIAVLCDKVWTDADGNRRTADRSRHGIHPVLGDGTTPGTFPTFDALNGRFTFDGGDYIQLRQADDVASVLADMGSAQSETYIIHFAPYVIGGINQEFVSTNDGANPRILIRHLAAPTNRFEMQFLDAGGGNELTLTPNDTIQEFDGKEVVMICTREVAATATHRIFMNGVQRWTSAGLTTRDASSAKNPHIGSTPVPGSLFANGTGLRFFGYAQQAFTQLQLEAIQRFLRGNL